MHETGLRALLAELTERHAVPGAQLVVHHGGRTLSVATGEHRFGGGEPVTPRSAFPLGSLTKPFTAAVAMELVAAGDVDLDLPLAAHLPEFGAGRAVTLRQLLSHTSGLPANVAEGTEHVRDRRRWVARHCREADLVHPPGTVFSYSNVGYVVAGLLVEEITGMSWAETLDAFLFDPLGVTACLADDADPRLVAGHAAGAVPGRAPAAVAQHLPPLEAPNGALALSAEQLALFARCFTAGERPAGAPGREVTEPMCRDQLGAARVGPFGLADGWGLGWARYGEAPDETWYGHDGTGDGTCCHLRFDPAGGTVVALTANANTGHALWRELTGRLRAAGVPVADHWPPCEPGPPPPEHDDVAGTYVNGDAEFEIGRAAGGRLLLSLGGRPYGELTWHPGLRFTMRELTGAALTHPGRFLPDPETGRIAYLQLSGRLARRRERGAR